MQNSYFYSIEILLPLKVNADIQKYPSQKSNHLAPGGQYFLK